MDFCHVCGARQQRKPSATDQAAQNGEERVSQHSGVPTNPQTMATPIVQQNMVVPQRSSTSRPSFLKLPPELRNIIYDYVVQSSEPVCISGIPVEGGYRATQLRTGAEGDLLGVAPLLRVNKQVKDEASARLYSTNKFIFHETSDLIIFFLIIGKNEKASLKDIQVLQSRADREEGMNLATCFKALIGCSAYNLKRLVFNEITTRPTANRYSGVKGAAKKLMHVAGPFFRHLVEHGKTSDEIIKMFNFKRVAVHYYIRMVDRPITFEQHRMNKEDKATFRRELEHSLDQLKANVDTAKASLDTAKANLGTTR